MNLLEICAAAAERGNVRRAAAERACSASERAGERGCRLAPAPAASPEGARASAVAVATDGAHRLPRPSPPAPARPSACRRAGPPHPAGRSPVSLETGPAAPSACAGDLRLGYVLHPRGDIGLPESALVVASPLEGRSTACHDALRNPSHDAAACGSQQQPCAPCRTRPCRAVKLLIFVRPECVTRIRTAAFDAQRVSERERARERARGARERRARARFVARAVRRG